MGINKYLREDNLPTVLMEFIETTDFGGKVLAEAEKPILKNFLFSTNDEYRLKSALALSKIILKKTDIDDAQYFRETLLRREITENISYENQRDHTSHTLHNYLMGCYIFNNCTYYAGYFNEYVKSRIKYHPTDVFIGVWPLVSILHDIGYIFEGAIRSLDLNNSYKELNVAQGIINDYFTSRFWREVNMVSIEQKNIILSIVKHETPVFNGKSIYEVSDIFRSLRIPNKFFNLLKKSFKSSKSDIEITLTGKKDSIYDIFDLWIEHFNSYNNNKMVKRINSLRNYFESLLDQGMPGKHLRILDHGVMSGFLLMQFSTFYMIYHFLLADYYEKTEANKPILDIFFNRLKNSTGEYSIQWWWEGILWASAATANHNFMQSNIIEPLSIDEEPLTFLGILVDIIQEWDRYAVFSNPFNSNMNTLQGLDVSLTTKNKLIELNFHDENIKKRIVNNLNNSLKGWDKVINIG